VAGYSAVATGSRCSLVYRWSTRVQHFLVPPLVCFLGSLRVRWCFATRSKEAVVFVADVETPD
ncbi:hypothetical protein A2U01_0104678, partial [Trifolium medium]|nr:hypothetical protein [Trifolium medium]